MKLRELCSEFKYECLSGSMDVDVRDVIYDSRKKYIPDAVKKGASAIVVERADEAQQIPDQITVIQVESARRALAYMSAALFGHPDRKLVTIGITGTKGKTTTTYMIKSVLEMAGKKVGLIGTIGAMIGDELIPSKYTTPESYELHRMFAAMVEAGCEYVVMEVSSQGLKLDRTAGILFDYGVFTNLSPDHIGPAEHESFEEYLYCKSLLFRQCRVGIVNADDPHWEEILKGHTCQVRTFSAEGNDVKDQVVDLFASDIGYINEGGRLGMHFTVSGCMDCKVKVHIPGRFSVYNAMVTMLVCNLAGIPDRDFGDLAADLAALGDLPFPVLDPGAAEAMRVAIRAAAQDGDSVGGILETAVTGLPAGVGEPWFDTVEGVLAHALFAIPAVKGVEFGAGFGFAGLRGSEANDGMRMENGRVSHLTNRNGGVTGGITNGEPLRFRCVIKPTPSIAREQQSVDLVTGENVRLTVRGRHDPAIIHRARVVVDSVTALVLADLLTGRYGTDWLAQ